MNTPTNTCAACARTRWTLSLLLFGNHSELAWVTSGLAKLGLDPKNIKYVLVSHAHRDHVGGASYLQDRFGARVVMSAADWDLLGRTGGAWPKPKRDIVATDGQHLTLGDTTLTLYLTPGHTLGTISSLIPVKDGKAAHRSPVGRSCIQLARKQGSVHNTG